MKEVKLIQADFRDYDRRINELLAKGWELDGQPHIVSKESGDPKSVIQRLLRDKVVSSESCTKKENN